MGASHADDSRQDNDNIAGDARDEYGDSLGWRWRWSWALGGTPFQGQVVKRRNATALGAIYSNQESATISMTGCGR